MGVNGGMFKYIVAARHAVLSQNRVTPGWNACPSVLLHVMERVVKGACTKRERNEVAWYGTHKMSLMIQTTNARICLIIDVY